MSTHYLQTTSLFLTCPSASSGRHYTSLQTPLSIYGLFIHSPETKEEKRLKRDCFLLDTRNEPIYVSIWYLKTTYCLKYLCHFDKCFICSGSYNIKFYNFVTKKLIVQMVFYTFPHLYDIAMRIHEIDMLTFMIWIFPKRQ